MRRGLGCPQVRVRAASPAVQAGLAVTPRAGVTEPARGGPEWGDQRLTMRSHVRQYPVMSIDHLSPAQAAIRAKCGRATIMRAIKSGELKAVKDNDARWRIDPDLLDDWAGQRRSPDRSRDDQSPPVTADTNPDSPLDSPTDTQSESVQQRIEIATLTAERDGLISRLADAHAERDWLRAELARAQEPLLTRIRRSLTGRSGA